METSPVVPEARPRRRLSYMFLAIGCILLVIAFLVGISDNPPGILSMFLGVFSVILGIVYLIGKSAGRKTSRELLYWAPRVLCIAYALFISLFALDVFGEGRNFWETAFALFMHLIPTFLIVILLVVSWRREWVGGVFFLVLAVLYVISSWNRPMITWGTYLLIAGPLVVTGALFLINWHFRGVLRGGSA